MTERKRAALDLGPDDDGAGGPDLDISGFAPKAAPAPPEAPKTDKAAIKQLSEASGWPSREAGPTPVRRRPRRQTSPFTLQLNVKCSPAMRDLFREISDRAGHRDCDTFEWAQGTLIAQLGDAELERRYGEILGGDQLSS